MQRGNDAAFKFEQEANFWYLTGINEPDWRLIIDGKRHKSWLVRPEISDVHQTFDGSLDSDEAIRISGVDGVLTMDEATRMLRDLSLQHSVVYALSDPPHLEYYDFVLNPAQKKLWRNLSTIFNDVQDCRLDISKLRVVKQPEEIEAIKKAIKLTNDSFALVKQKLNSLKHEHEIEAEFNYAFTKKQATHAYDPIVAGGLNACTLHYDKNNSRLKDGSVILIDIGARLGGYAADVTRSYGYGQMSERQNQVHGEVEKAHKKIIKLLGPDVSVAEYFNQVDEIMKSALINLGLMTGPEDTENYRRYFPHSVSHGLGIDVHDSLGRSESFQPGMVLTVEPGIYIPEESIGVRIEDDILITESGRLNLSRGLATSL
jgi:Xaa-Pro aminopeptidase